LPTRLHLGQHRALLSLLLPQSLDLKSLAFQLALLLGDLCLGLCLLIFPVLHRIADRKTSNPSQRTTDCRARARRAYCRTDYRAGCRADADSPQSASFARAKWLTATPGGSDQPEQTDQTNRNPLPRLQGVILPCAKPFNQTGH
jgi:hypothetical protein